MANTDNDQLKDLIDDRSVASLAEDKLSYTHFAATLKDLILSANTPSNIALFGAWGSGKSGLANLLKTLLADHKYVKFARFDAFKYAETPLRKQFLTQIAAVLLPESEAKKIHDQLYVATTENRIKFPLWETLKIVVIFVSILASISAVAALLKGVLSPLHLTRAILLTSWSDLILAGSFPAAVATAFISLTGKSFTVARTHAVPSSDEQFEQAFKELVAAAGGDRIVVFIDELDRCSSAEVVSTLETIRTFLEVKKCVFIVAADQQVLEKALTEKVRQATPLDELNPQYSAGNEYLDKIFQYQISLPPLMPRRLSSYALELVKNKGGIWREVNAEQVISVLIPTHVHSPRRVKALLNAFVLSYRIAQQRAAESILPGAITERAAELAKLVCLRHEFPRFANDLNKDARLTRLVVQLADGSDTKLPDELPAELVNLAKKYASQKLQVGQILVPEENHETEDDTDLSRTVSVTRNYADQLIKYLHKTFHVPGPNKDLIYLEGSGTIYGLDPEYAEEIEDLAVNGQAARIIEKLKVLPEEIISKSLLLLSSRVREASIGIEGSNAVSTLLMALGDSDLMPATAQIADDLADAIALHLRRHDLRSGDLRGAFMLAIHTQRPAGKTLLSSVLNRPEIVVDKDLGLLILSNAATLDSDYCETLSHVFYSRLIDTMTVQQASQCLLELPDSLSAKITEHMLSPLITALKDEHTTKKEAEKENPNKDDTTNIFTALTHALDMILKSPSRRLAEYFLGVFLSIDTTEGRNLVQAQLKRLGNVSSVELTRLIIRSVQRRDVDAWPNWLSPLTPAIVQVNVTDNELMDLKTKLWSSAIDKIKNKNFNSEMIRATINATFSISSEIQIDNDSRFIEAVLEGAEATPSTQDALLQFEGALNLMSMLIEGNLLKKELVADDYIGTLESLLKTSRPATLPAATVISFIDKWLPRLLDAASVTCITTMQEAVENSPWLSSPNTEIYELHLLAAKKRLLPETEYPYGATGIHDLVVEHEDGFAAGLVVWLRHFAKNGSEVYVAAQHYCQHPIPAEISLALEKYTAGLNEADRLALVRPAIEEASVEVPSQGYFEAIRFSEVDSQTVADILKARFHGATNHDERSKVLKIWQSLMPRRESVSKDLIKHIYLPVARMGKGGHDLALRYFNLVRTPPSGTKKIIIEALLATDDYDQRKRAERLLREAGYRVRGRFLRGLLGDADQDDEA